MIGGENDGDRITVDQWAAPRHVVTTKGPVRVPDDIDALFPTPDEIRNAIIGDLAPLAVVRVTAPAFKLSVHGVDYARDKVICMVKIAHTLIDTRDTDKIRAALIEGCSLVAAHIKAKAVERGLSVVRDRTLGLLARFSKDAWSFLEADDDSDNWMLRLGGYYFLTPYGAARDSRDGGRR